jgi:hypothetical protein
VNNVNKSSIFIPERGHQTGNNLANAKIRVRTLLLVLCFDDLIIISTRREFSRKALIKSPDEANDFCWFVSSFNPTHSSIRHSIDAVISARIGEYRGVIVLNEANENSTICFMAENSDYRR